MQSLMRTNSHLYLDLIIWFWVQLKLYYGLEVLEKVFEEVVVQQLELRKSKKIRIPKSFGPEFHLYLIEGTRDEVSDQHSYFFNVEDDPKTFDETMKSPDSTSLKRRLFLTPGLVESSSLEFDLFSNIKEHSEEEETAEIMMETMEKYMSKTRENYGSGVARLKIDDKTHFELKRAISQGTSRKYFQRLDVLTRQILDSKGVIPTKIATDAKVAIQEMAELTTQSLVHPINLEDSTEQQGQDSTNTTMEILTIRNQGASIKTLEIQIGQMSKVLQERGFENQDHTPYKTHSTEAREVKILETYDNTLPQKEKDPGSFTLPCFIHNVCFDKALVDLRASVSVIPFSTYTNLGLGDLAHTRLTIELADRTIKHPRGIAKNVLVRIGKFIFLIDFVILDIPEDDDVPLILGRPFLSTTHAKIDVFKRKITLRVGEEKLVFKSIKPATSIIRRVYMVKEITDLDSKTEIIGEPINESFDPHYGNYIELNDLDVPLEPRMNQDDEFEPTLDFVNEPSYKSCYKMKFSCMIWYKHVIADFLPTLSINMMTKRFYNSIIKDKGDHEGKKLAGTLIDIPIFVGNFSSISGFSIIDDMDITSGVVLGMPFCKKFVPCQKIMERFAHGDECERIDDDERSEVKKKSNLKTG
ncbi:retrovirus-related pol polyprotein from transposon TNT 1-94 [Tanacetum coccineum]